MSVNNYTLEEIFEAILNAEITITDFENWVEGVEERALSNSTDTDWSEGHSEGYAEGYAAAQEEGYAAAQEES